MHHFRYEGDELYCESVPLRKIARDVATPCYVYSCATLRQHFTVFDNAFDGMQHLTCYSVKANGNLSILGLFAGLGGGADIVSGGELFKARQAGIPADRIVYSGVGKTQAEIDYALREDILMFNIESAQELEAINQRAGAMKTRARIALRVNPDVDPKTHPYISTGLKKNKFGIDIEQALKSYERAKQLEHIDVVGIDCHIGSQLTEIPPFIEALERLKLLIGRLHAIGIRIQCLDLGGGLGISYHQESPPHPREYAQAIVERLKDLPDVATTGQQGLAAVNTQFWIGFSGPPGLPEHVMKSWAEGVSEVLKSPDVIAKLARITSAATFLGPEEFKRFISEESRMVKELMGER